MEVIAILVHNTGKFVNHLHIFAAFAFYMAETKHLKYLVLFYYVGTQSQEGNLFVVPLVVCLWCESTFNIAQTYYSDI